MITREEISRLSHRMQINEITLEKDYVLTWILLSIEDSNLYSQLIFKGGTALKKIYFPDYRFSEDLDFTVLNEIGTNDLISNIKLMLNNLSKNQGLQFDISSEKIEVRTNTLTIYIGFIGPLQARLGSRFIKVDFTLNEKLLFNINPLFIQSFYSDVIKKQINTYSLEEIMVEKLCAIVGRNEPRDIYDIYFLFEQDLDFITIPSAFIEKAKFKEINPNDIRGLFKRKKNIIERMWKTRLTNQVKNLPDIDSVLRKIEYNLRKHIYDYI
ncbi:MAG: nucleotidyl transferase AbiEii/AbiGii toxin family protein [Actinobacteria bacterium]|nr:nucleotidyl transferase AbiEii/AbiGii toxin family protein [Actinomycetota bacterium]